MNIIREQREDIIQNNNTAQQHLLDILETLSPRATTLIFRERLYGDLDFAPIKEGGFRLLKTIIIPEGEITSIINIPETVEHLECTKNMIFALENLPPSIQVLNLSFNYLTKIDVSALKNLKKLIVSHNKIVKLENLPEEIQELRCDFNEIEYLDLKNLYVLKILNVSNNRITIIDNMPEGIVEFQMENTPSIEFRNSAGEIPTATKQTGDAGEDEGMQKRNYTEALNEYFALKSDYEASVFKLKKKVYDSEPNKRLARRKILSLKPKCIHCKRPVGTIFTKRDSRYVAICGDTVGSACSLNIEIYNGNTKNLYDILSMFKDDVTEIKDTIIRQKLDTIFNYISEEKSVELFKKELTLYNGDINIYKDLLEKYVNIYNNEENMKISAKKWEDIFRIIEDNKKLLAEFEQTGNRELLKTAMENQVNGIFPEIRNMRMMNNKIMEMNETTTIMGFAGSGGEKKEYTLFKYPVLLPQIEELVGEPPRVIKFAV